MSKILETDKKERSKILETDKIYYFGRSLRGIGNGYLYGIVLFPLTAAIMLLLIELSNNYVWSTLIWLDIIMVIIVIASIFVVNLFANSVLLCYQGFSIGKLLKKKSFITFSIINLLSIIMIIIYFVYILVKTIPSFVLFYEQTQYLAAYRGSISGASLPSYLAPFFNLNYSNSVVDAINNALKNPFLWLIAKISPNAISNSNLFLFFPYLIFLPAMILKTISLGFLKNGLRKTGEINIGNFSFIAGKRITRAFSMMILIIFFGTIMYIEFYPEVLYSTEIITIVTFIILNLIFFCIFISGYMSAGKYLKKIRLSSATPLELVVPIPSKNEIDNVNKEPHHFGSLWPENQIAKQVSTQPVLPTTQSTQSTTRSMQPTTKSLEKITCSYCGKINDSENGFCIRCGKNLSSDQNQISTQTTTGEKNCPKCGAINDSENKFCVGCGQTFES